jgi:hypothetical protein
VGTITNRAGAPLRDIIVRVSGGSLLIRGDPLPPGASLQLDQQLQYTDMPYRTVAQEAGRRDGVAWYYAHVDGTQRPLIADEYPQTASEWYWSLFDLGAQRSRSIDELLSGRADAACVYAECVDPQASVTITDPTAKQQHWQFVRAVVPISTRENQ